MICMTCDKPKPTNSIKRCDECIRIANANNVAHWRQVKAERTANRTFTALMIGWVVL